VKKLHRLSVTDSVDTGS